jgi:hypothetical protein
MSTSFKIKWRDGHEFDSLQELVVWLGVLRDAGLPVAHNAMIPRKFGMSWRKPDFFIPCTCGMHGIVWEHCGMLDNPAYLQKWLVERLPWYEAHADWYLLVITDQANDFVKLQETVDLIRRLWENDCKGLHKVLQSDVSREHLAGIREKMSARRQLRAA